MKKMIWIWIGLVLLAACSSEGNAENEAAAETDVQAEQTEVEKTESKEGGPFIESPQAPDDSRLTEIGESLRDQDGEIKLLGYAPEAKSLEAGPFEMSIEEVKYMNYQPSPDMIDFFHGFSHDETNFNYVKVRVVIENTSDETLNFAPVNKLEANSGETKGFADDFYMEELHGDYEPGEKRYGQLGFIFDETEPEELSEVMIETSDVFKDGEAVNEGDSVTVSF
ncbi:DUF4352 domain-containing protein [Halobacillus fulvus]|nr:DUF4352 domain-containing protein [Halobacillus fulvus]